MSFRVLIVDDSHADRFVLSRLLETMGHTAAVADDGREALRIVPAFRPEVIISDVSMPHMNGLQLAERIRADRSLSRILLVALTGYGQESDRRRAMMSGFDLHLTKPVGVSDLDAVFEQLSQHSTDPHMKSRR